MVLVIPGGIPAQAQPGVGVPDDGARPTPNGQLPLPGVGFPPVTAPPGGSATAIGPLAAEIATKQLEINTITQQLQALEPQLAPAGTAAELAEQQWLTAGEELAVAEEALDELVGESYRGAAVVPPELFISEWSALNAHAPPVPVDVPTGAEAAARHLIDARERARIAQDEFNRATAQSETLEEQAATLEDQLADYEAELDDLLDENLELLVAEEREREQQQQQLADDFLSTQPVNGFEPHARAVRAVQHALSQLGKPYVWGAEGPSAYDCSGLVLWSHSHADSRASLPRVAADQYWGTRNRLVTRSAAVAQLGLLPGDLVFFASGPSWQSIHHVGIYVGQGQMVHAPNSREVVKVSPVWWSRFFAATRVFPATPVTPISPDPQPGPSPTPPGSTRPPTTRPPVTTRPPDPPTTNPPPTTSPPPSSSPPDDPTTSPPDDTSSPPDDPSTPPEEDPTEEPQDPPTNPPAEEPSQSPESSPSEIPTGSASSPSPTAN